MLFCRKYFVGKILMNGYLFVKFVKILTIEETRYTVSKADNQTQHASTYITVLSRSIVVNTL